ncbi:MAG: glycosyl hydrolase family 18 protein [Bacteroides sp.]|nr:glycosyl hydrolase family 18 protein [Bacteroides sp.]MCM1389715.1 glycosyl hydrolase family 18 protein [Bacteroides sp.]
MRLFLTILLLSIVHLNSIATSNDSIRNHIVAYVTSWSEDIPDPDYMTHINYAFGHVNDTFDGVRVDNPSRFHRISRLKRINPKLKVLLSIGGWGSGRFSEMAADAVLRSAFASDCRRIVDEYGIDGIDIDWEYPGSDIAGISSSKNDEENFVLLLKQIREALGSSHLLTIASAASGTGCRFVDLLPYVDFINIMAYDMAHAPHFHSALHESPLSGNMTAEVAVNTHLAAGVPPAKLVLGIPFYGRGKKPYDNFVDYGKIILHQGCSQLWDATAMVPYIVDKSGNVVLSFDNPESIKLK